MLKVDNIISLWRFVIPNMVSDLTMSIESSNNEQKSFEPQKCSQKWLKCRTNGVHCSMSSKEGVD